MCENILDGRVVDLASEKSSLIESAGKVRQGDENLLDGVCGGACERQGDFPLPILLPGVPTDVD